MLILIQNNDLGISCVVEQSLFTVTVHSVLSNVAKTPRGIVVCEPMSLT